MGWRWKEREEDGSGGKASASGSWCGGDVMQFCVRSSRCMYHTVVDVNGNLKFSTIPNFWKSFDEWLLHKIKLCERVCSFCSIVLQFFSETTVCRMQQTDLCRREFLVAIARFPFGHGLAFGGGCKFWSVNCRESRRMCRRFVRLSLPKLLTSHRIKQNSCKDLAEILV